jgi:hypothetical protein
MTLLVVSLVLCGAPAADKPKPLPLPIEKLEQVSCTVLDEPSAFRLIPLKPSEPPAEDTTRDYGACGRVKLPGDFDGRLVRVHTALPAAEKTELLLVALAANGKPPCQATLSLAYGSEAGSSNPSTRLNADLTVETSAVGNYPVQDIEGLNEIVTTRTTRSALRLPGCKLETISTEWNDLNGVFTDPKSHEMLLVSGKRVFYRAKPEKKAVELKVPRIDSSSASVQFGKSPKVYELELEGDVLSCTNPDGTVQTFKRTF